MQGFCSPASKRQHNSGERYFASTKSGRLTANLVVQIEAIVRPRVLLLNSMLAELDERELAELGINCGSLFDVLDLHVVHRLDILVDLSVDASNLASVLAECRSWLEFQPQ